MVYTIIRLCILHTSSLRKLSSASLTESSNSYCYYVVAVRFLHNNSISGLCCIMSSSSLFLRLFHIVIVGALFLYVGIQRTSIPKWMFPALLVLGIIIVFYHIYKSVIHIQDKKGYWVNLIHILLIGPLLIYIGYYGEDTARLYFELLLMSSFAVIGYHGFYLIQDAIPLK